MELKPGWNVKWGGGVGGEETDNASNDSFKNYGNKGQKTGRQLKRAVSQGRVDFKVTRWGIFTCEWEEIHPSSRDGRMKVQKSKKAEWQPQWSGICSLGSILVFHLLPMWLGAGYLGLYASVSLSVKWRENGTSIGRIKWERIYGKGWGLDRVPLPMQIQSCISCLYSSPELRH